MLKLEINTGNAAFDMRDQGAHETARILRLVADELERRSAPCGGSCVDYNGNKVGEWSYDYDGIKLPFEINYDLEDIGYQGDKEEINETIIKDLIVQKLLSEFNQTPYSFELVSNEEYQNGKFITTSYTITNIDWGY